MSVPLLVSTEWLAKHLGDPDLRIVDVRWALADRDRGRNAYLQGHVPGAVFLDVDTDLSSARGEGPGRHPLPRPERFAESLSGAGVASNTHVIAYDAGDGSTASRLWWLLRYFGHDRVSLLDGGMTRWEAESRPLERRPAQYPRSEFTATPHLGMVVSADVVERLRNDPLALVLDTRLPERYEGKTEPIDPIPGHIPGAKSNPYPANLRSYADPRFLEPAKLRQQFRQLGAARAQRIICYCGSGVNACQNLFALELAGFKNGQLYEGSWSDWCSVPTRAMRTGRDP